jgi:hypothetical protein
MRSSGMNSSRLGGTVSSSATQFGSEDCLNHLHSESLRWELSLSATEHLGHVDTMRHSASQRVCVTSRNTAPTGNWTGKVVGKVGKVG